MPSIEHPSSLATNCSMKDLHAAEGIKTCASNTTDVGEQVNQLTNEQKNENHTCQLSREHTVDPRKIQLDVQALPLENTAIGGDCAGQTLAWLRLAKDGVQHLEVDITL